MFMEAIPDGYDNTTDGIKESLRIELAGTMNAQSTSSVPISAADKIAYPMIMVLLIGCVLFAKNSLRGQPQLQQRLVELAVYTALGSDVSTFLPLVESADA
jgi:hypothetical protein